MESLEKHARKLTDILEKQYALYLQIYELITDEQDVIVAADIDKLDLNLVKQKEISARIDILEAKRLEELEVLGIYVGSLPERIKLSQLAGLVDKELSERLLTLEGQFKEVLKNIMDVNKTNKYLINRSMMFVEQNVQAFFGALDDNKGLYKPGNQTQKQSSLSRRMIDWKA